MKKALILNGSNNEIMLIEAAKRLGFYVITSGNNPSLMGHRLADEYICCDYTDHEKMLDIARELKIDAVISNCNDLGMMTATYINEQMGLAGVYDTYETARIFHEKDAFKRFVEKHGVLSAKSISFDDEVEAVEYLDAVKYPIIVKPVDLCGGRGIRKAVNRNEAAEAIANAFRQSLAKRILLEEYIEGRQYDFHTQIVGEKIVWDSVSNEYTTVNPFRVSGLCIPGDHSEKITEKLRQVIEKMAGLLHVADGPLWLQYKVRGDEAYIIESARRCGGNNMLDLISRGYQKDFAEYIVRIESGLEYKHYLEGITLYKPQGYQAFFAPRNGVVKKVCISDSLKEHIYKTYRWNPDGVSITDYLHDELGLVLFEYDSLEEMSDLYAHIENHVRVIMS